MKQFFRNPALSGGGLRLLGGFYSKFILAGLDFFSLREKSIKFRKNILTDYNFLILFSKQYKNKLPV